MKKEEMQKEIQDWIDAEESAGRPVDMPRLNQYIQLLIRRHNNTPRGEFDGLSPEQMQQLVHQPFNDKCIVQLNKLSKEQYERIPLVRQTLFLLKTLSEKEVKLTKLGWLPFKIVAATYSLGQPDWVVEEFGSKRYFEYDVNSVWMARLIIEVLGWTKIRKGALSLTARGKKALTDVDEAVIDILLCSLCEMNMHMFDGYNEDEIGNYCRAFSVWLLNKYGSEWHSGYFYTSLYENAFHLPGNHEAYVTRVFSRLFYWLGLIETKDGKEPLGFSEHEFKKTDLLSMIFSFKE